MNRRYLLSLSSVLYFVSLCAVSAMLANALNLITFAHGEKIFTGFLVVLSGYGAAVLRAFSYENKNREKIIKHQILLPLLMRIWAGIFITCFRGTGLRSGNI